MTFKPGEIFAEHYQLIKCLGAGSFGEVWLARNLMTDINMAIKFYKGLDHNGINDFKEEFKLAYRLSHPNLLHLNHFDVYEQCPYLVMPYCTKGATSSLRGNVSETRIWEFIRDVSAGLAHLHSQNPPIIHQDIKLGNILIDENDHFIVTDFGISKKIEFHMQTLRSVKMESTGTIAYMGPERFKTPPVVVKASDIWSLGICVYELVTGQVLWELGGLTQLSGAEIPSLGGNYSVQLSLFFQRCIAANAWERPTAQQAYEEAKAKLSGEIYHSRSVTLPPISRSVELLNQNSSNQYRGMTGQRVSQSFSFREVDKKLEPTFWGKYGSVLKWGCGAMLLFVIALGVFSLLLADDEKKKKVPKPVVIDNPHKEESETIPKDTIIIPVVNPETPKGDGPYIKRNHHSKSSGEHQSKFTPKPVINAEEELWNRCEKENRVFMYNKYINEFPKGKYVKEAKKRIQKLERMDSKNVIY